MNMVGSYYLYTLLCIVILNLFSYESNMDWLWVFWNSFIRCLPYSGRLFNDFLRDNIWRSQIFVNPWNCRGNMCLFLVGWIRGWSKPCHLHFSAGGPASAYQPRPDHDALAFALWYCCSGPVLYNCQSPTQDCLLS